jgi:hypothetical protein
MAGKSKFAERMSSHLNEPVDAACPITRTGGTTAQIGGTVGGAVGAVISGRGSQAESDVKIGQFAWLGVGPSHFALTEASFTGKPKGEPLARAAYAEVASVLLTDGKLTTRVDVDLADGRHIAFEAKRHGQNKANTEVLEQLRDRANTA